MSQNAPECISGHIHLKKEIPGGHAPDPLGRGHLGLLPQMIFFFFFFFFNEYFIYNKGTTLIQLTNNK